MQKKVNPKNGTNIKIAPAEEPGYDVAMMVSNEHIDAVLYFTEADVRALVAQFSKYVQI
jgi:hypothetical protein